MKANTRIVLLATAWGYCFATAPAMAQDCRAIRRACVAHCVGGAGSTGDLNAVRPAPTLAAESCVNRCSIAPCLSTSSARLPAYRSVFRVPFVPVPMRAPHQPRPRRPLSRVRLHGATISHIPFKQCLVDPPVRHKHHYRYFTCEENVLGSINKKAVKLVIKAHVAITQGLLC